MSDFNSNIIKWMNHDTEIKKYNDKIKSLKTEKNTLETNILSHIENNNLQNNIFNLPAFSSKLQYNSNKSYETMTNKFLKDKFTKFFNDGEKAIELLEFLKNERKSENKVCLKRN